MTYLQSFVVIELSVHYKKKVDTFEKQYIYSKSHWCIAANIHLQKNFWGEVIGVLGQTYMTAGLCCGVGFTVLENGGRSHMV